MLKRFLPLILILSLLNCGRRTSQTITGPSNTEPDPSLPYVQELDSLIHPITTVSPNVNFDDLQPLSFLGDAKIVGLGEATHGTREFFLMKHRLFRFLVEEHGFKIFAIEADMGESIYIDRYVTTGEGDIHQIMMDKMHFYTWKTEAVKDLIEWMKTYNEGKAEEDKIHYMGVDCQYMTFQPDLLLEYFNRVKPDIIDEINPTLDMIRGMGETTSDVRNYYEAMDQVEYEALSDSLAHVLAKIIDIKDELIANSSDLEYQQVRQLAINLQQVNDTKYEYYNEQNVNYRDQYMAENAIWQAFLFGDDTKIALWAHNGHVANYPYYGGTGSLGSHLKYRLGRWYQIVGFSFSTGSFTAVVPGNGLSTLSIDDSPVEGSINRLFSKAQFDNFILNIEDIQSGTELDDWISTPRLFLSIGASYNGIPENYYDNIPLRSCYNVIIHYDITTATMLLHN
jgi:erythromycin esterase